MRGCPGNLSHAWVYCRISQIWTPCDSQSADVTFGGATEVFVCLRQRLRVAIIWPCEDLEQQRHITHGARHRADHREIRPPIGAWIAWNTPQAGFEAHNTTAAGWNT